MENKKKNIIIGVLVVVIAAGSFFVGRLTSGNSVKKTQNIVSVKENEAKDEAASKNAKTLLDIYKINHEAYLKQLESYEKDAEKVTEIYNNLGYKNVTGLTLGEAYTEHGYEGDGLSFEGFLKRKGYQSNLTKDVYFEIPIYIASVIDIGLDVQSVEDLYGVKEVTVSGETLPVTEDMPFGLILDEFKIADAVASLNALTIRKDEIYSKEDFDLAAFKEKYGLGDEVTEETKWKEIRETIEEADMKALAEK